MAALGDGLLVWGGRGEQGLLNDGARFLERTNQWVPMSREGAPSPREEFAWALAGKWLLVAGGKADGILADAFVYDVLTDRWAPLPASPAPGPRHLAAAVGTALSNGVRFYVLGGLGPEGALHDLWALDLVDGASVQWTRLSEGCPLQQPPVRSPFQTRGMSLFLVPGVFSPLAFSGLGIDGTQARAAVFDLGTSQWTLDEVSRAPRPREGASAVYDGRWLIIEGGVHPGAQPGEDLADYVADGAYLQPVRPEVPDGGTGDAGPRWEWTSFRDSARTTVPRAFHAAVTTGDTVLVAGGNDPGYCGGGARWDLSRWDRLSVAQAPGPLPLAGGVWLTPSLDADGGVQGGGFYVFGGHRPSALTGTPPLVLRWIP